jgi:phospholipid-binding lipoprotein MlaA
VWIFVAAALAAGGCGSISGGLRPDLAMGVSTGPGGESDPTGTPTPAEAGPAEAAEVREAAAEAEPASLEPADFRGVLLASTDPLVVPLDVLLAQATRDGPKDEPADLDTEEYDPWEPFNETMFTVNRQLDRYLIKPVAQAWDFVLPDVIIDMLDNGFRNFATGPRLANQLLQGRFKAAGIETGRFLINSTLGIAGLFDIARTEFGLQPQRADFGQTLGSWGAPPGPYLILPLFPPSTVRDAIGTAVDGFLDPFSWIIPFIWERLVLKVVDTINSRAINLELFEGFEETTLELYSSVRNGYLQRRNQMVREAIQDSVWNLKTKEQLR